MTSTTTEGLPAVHAYVTLLLQLDALMAEGKGDSPEADAVREQMDEPWYAMTEQEQQRVRGLSEDLFSLAEGGAKSVAMSAAEKQQWVREAQTSLRVAEDPDAALAFLRWPFPVGGPAFTIPFLQSRCWESLGDLEVALRFMREAERLSPAQSVCVLILLDKLGRKEDAEAYANRIIDNPKSRPDDLYLAAAPLLEPTRHMADAQAKPILERIVPVLQRALDAVRRISGNQLGIPKPAQRMDGNQLDIPDVDLSITFMLGLCYERLGKELYALQLYDEALAHYQDHGDLLAARGVAGYDADRVSALKDFERARKAGTSWIWPYYYLAHDALNQGAFHACLRFCLEGLDCHGGTDQARHNSTSGSLYRRQWWANLCQQCWRTSSTRNDWTPTTTASGPTGSLQNRKPSRSLMGLVSGRKLR